MSCTCFIIPKDILDKLAKDVDLSEELRKGLDHTSHLSTELRKLRDQAVAFTNATHLAGALPIAALAPSPAVTVYDCKHHQTTPGTPVPNPGSSADLTASRTFNETKAVADFYQKVFGRNSIDGAGMTMLSSIHYGVNYNNAMWNGSQMIYGDGDNQIFTDFTNGNDVIGHELTHGVTQHTLQLVYSDDAGGLNESISDCFGSMFRQWQANQDVNHADWLIGHDILGPVAKTKGYTCLRNMANPADPHCIAPQPTKYSQITPGMDPHYTSGPPNLAFYLACHTVGGKSWEKVGQIWYSAITGGASPNMKMKEFADRTRKLATQKYGTVPAIATAVDNAWKQVGL
jgi:Zn-dependent metalloprotease